MLFSNIAFTSEAQAADDVMSETGDGGLESQVMSLVPIVLIFMVFYFLLIRPQQKRAKEHRKVLSELKKGDTVITSGGLIGKVIKVADSDDIVDVEFGSQAKMRVLKNAIAQVTDRKELMSSPDKESKSSSSASNETKTPKKAKGKKKAASTSSIEEVAVTATKNDNVSIDDYSSSDKNPEEAAGDGSMLSEDESKK